MAKDFSKAFYNSLQWKKIRAFVLTRDFYMCKVCGAAHAKIVHHIRELTPMNIGDASISMNTDNLITVCEQCHDEIHSRNHRQEARCRFDAEGNVLPPTGGEADENRTARREYTARQWTLIKMYRRKLRR